MSSWSWSSFDVAKLNGAPPFLLLLALRFFWIAATSWGGVNGSRLPISWPIRGRSGREQSIGPDERTGVKVVEPLTAVDHPLGPVDSKGRGVVRQRGGRLLIHSSPAALMTTVADDDGRGGSIGRNRYFAPRLALAECGGFLVDANR